MNNPYKYYHESKEVFLKSKKLLSVSALRKVLNNLNFKEEETYDTLWLERTDKVEDWQSENVAVLSIFKNDNILYFDEKNEWDAIKLECCFASLPFSSTEKFLEIVSILAKTFDLDIVHEGIVMNENKLLDKFKVYRDELTKELDAPGEESTDMLISLSYPRTNTQHSEDYLAQINNMCKNDTSK
jgi:hypothetical protein